MSLLRRLSTRRYPHLLLSAGVCSYRSINPSATVAAVDRRDRQTDRRTDARPLQGLCSAYYDDAQLFAYGYADILATDFMLLGSSFCWFTAHRFNQYNVEGRRHGPRRAILSNIPRGRLFARNLLDDLSCVPRMIFTGSDGWTNRAGFWYGCNFRHPTLCCKKIRVSAKIRALPSGTLSYRLVGTLKISPRQIDRRNLISL